MVRYLHGRDEGIPWVAHMRVHQLARFEMYLLVTHNKHLENLTLLFMHYNEINM